MKQILKKLLNNQTGIARSFLTLALISSLLVGTGGYGFTGVSSAATAAPTATNVDVATYNLRSQRWDGQNRSQDTWAQRKSRVKAIIAKDQPGIIGMQEVIARNPDTGKKASQRNDVISFMRQMGYSHHVGSGNNSSPIFWKRNDFKLLNSNEVLIYDAATSRRNDRPASRHLTLVRLQQKQSKKNVIVMNYHFNQWEKAEDQLSKLKSNISTVRRILPTEDIFFAGDFNNMHGNVIGRLNSGGDRFRVADNHNGIDHILVTPGVSVRGSLSRGPGHPAATDHPMVIAKLKF